VAAPAAAAKAAAIAGGGEGETAAAAEAMIVDVATDDPAAAATAVCAAITAGASLLDESRAHLLHMPPVAWLPKKPHPLVHMVGSLPCWVDMILWCLLETVSVV